MNKVKRKSETRYIKNYRKFATKMIFAGILLVVCFPIIFTRSFGMLDFTETGQIGDTIGGITSPIIGLLGAVLVYFALIAQIEANEKIKKQIKLQKKHDYRSKVTSYLNLQLDAIRIDINEYKFIERTSTTIVGTYEGSEAISRFLKLYKDHKNENEEELRNDVYPLEQLLLLLKHIELYLDSLEYEKISQKDKDYLLNNIVYQYRSKIKIHLDYHKVHEEKPSAIYAVANSIENKLNLKQN